MGKSDTEFERTVVSENGPKRHATPDNVQHDLEAHIASLRDLDPVRTRSSAMRKEGLGFLSKWLVSEQFESESSSDQVTAARVVWQRPAPLQPKS